MKVTFLNSLDFDRALRENKHGDALDHESDDWQDEQFNLTGILEAELTARYSEEVFNRNEIFVSSNIRPTKVLHMDIYDTILSNSLITDLIGFLQRYAPDYAILSSINHISETLIDTMTGQFYVNLREICVEESAKEIWNQKVSL